MPYTDGVFQSEETSFKSHGFSSSTIIIIYALRQFRMIRMFELPFRNSFWKSKCLRCPPLWPARFNTKPMSVESGTGEKFSLSLSICPFSHTTNHALYFCILPFSSELGFRTIFVYSTHSSGGLSTSSQHCICLRLFTSLSMASHHCFRAFTFNSSRILGLSSSRAFAGVLIIRWDGWFLSRVGYLRASIFASFDTAESGTSSSGESHTGSLSNNYSSTLLSLSSVSYWICRQTVRSALELIPSRCGIWYFCSWLGAL